MLGAFARLFMRSRTSMRLLHAVNVAGAAMMNSAHFSQILRVYHRTGRLPLMRGFGKGRATFMTKDS